MMVYIIVILCYNTTVVIVRINIKEVNVIMGKRCAKCFKHYSDDSNICYDCNLYLISDGLFSKAKAKGMLEHLVASNQTKTYETSFDINLIPESKEDIERALQIQKEPVKTTHFCGKCYKKIEPGIQFCPHCGYTLNKPTPKCPTCQSTNIHKIGTFDRLTSVGFWGLASSKLGKTMACDDCGYKW